MSEADLCVVVGATGAMGSAVVRRLVARDLRVLAVARSSAALDALAATSSAISTCVADIGSDDAIDTIGATLERPELSGPVRMAVLAAGLPVRGSADTIDPALLTDGFTIKVGGLLRLVRAVRGVSSRGRDW